MREPIVIGTHGGCGGTIRVKDWHTHDMWRYEAWCEKCRSCDPNGYGSRKDTVVGASQYFKVKKAVKI